MNVCTFLCVVYVCVCEYVCRCVCVRVYIYIYIFMHVCMRMFIYVHVHCPVVHVPFGSHSFAATPLEHVRSAPPRSLIWLLQLGLTPPLAAAAMDLLNWPCPVPNKTPARTTRVPATGVSSGSGCHVRSRSFGGIAPRASPRSYKPREPTSAEYSRNFSCIGSIPVHDKISCLELCDAKYSHQSLLEYSHDESLLDAVVSGPQPTCLSVGCSLSARGAWATLG